MQSNKPCRTAHRPHRGNARVCPHSGAAPGRWQAGTPGRGGACRSPSKAVWTMLPCAHAVFSIYIFKSFKYFEKEILKERMPSSPSPQSHNQAPWASHPVTSSTGGGCRQDVTHLVPRICFCSSSQACVCSPVPGLPAGGASGRGAQSRTLGSHSGRDLVAGVCPRTWRLRHYTQREPPSPGVQPLGPGSSEEGP